MILGRAGTDFSFLIMRLALGIKLALTLCELLQRSVHQDGDRLPDLLTDPAPSSDAAAVDPRSISPLVTAPPDTLKCRCSAKRVDGHSPVTAASRAQTLDHTRGLCARSGASRNLKRR
jgi:hypothetical protein